MEVLDKMYSGDFPLKVGYNIRNIVQHHLDWNQVDVNDFESFLIYCPRILRKCWLSQVILVATTMSRKKLRRKSSYREGGIKQENDYLTHYYNYYLNN